MDVVFDETRRGIVCARSHDHSIHRVRRSGYEMMAWVDGQLACRRNERMR